MESSTQSNNAEQIPIKHNWSKFKSSRKEFNDDVSPNLTRSDAELLKSKIFSRKEKALTILSEQARNALNNEERKNYSKQIMMKFYDIEVKKAHNYIVENPEASYRVQFLVFKWAAEYGHPAGQYHLANCYLRGYGCEKSEEKAAEWQAKALINGYNESSSLKNEDQKKSEEWCSIF